MVHCIDHSWSLLPHHDLFSNFFKKYYLQAIGKRLLASYIIIYFMLVCKSWLFHFRHDSWFRIFYWSITKEQFINKKNSSLNPFYNLFQWHGRGSLSKKGTSKDFFFKESLTSQILKIQEKQSSSNILAVGQI